MSCTETCLRAGSIKLTNGIDSGLRIPPCVYFACVRIPGAREDSHSLRNQLIWDTTGLRPITVPQRMNTSGILSYGQSCSGWGSSSPNGIQCPPNVLYCQPPQPTETLFIGWNPPGTEHFWNCPQDKLRKSLAEVLYELGWNRQSCFIQQFLNRHCY